MPSKLIKAKSKIVLNLWSEVKPQQCRLEPFAVKCHNDITRWNLHTELCTGPIKGKAAMYKIKSFNSIWKVKVSKDCNERRWTWSKFISSFLQNVTFTSTPWQHTPLWRYTQITVIESNIVKHTFLIFNIWTISDRSVLERYNLYCYFTRKCKKRWSYKTGRPNRPVSGDAH